MKKIDFNEKFWILLAVALLFAMIGFGAGYEYSNQYNPTVDKVIFNFEANNNQISLETLDYDCVQEIQKLEKEDNSREKDER